MPLGHVQSAQGYGWEIAVGDGTCWFGRGRSGRLLGAFSSVLDLLDAFDDETDARGDFKVDVAADRSMTADAVSYAPRNGSWVVFVLRIAGKIAGFCVTTAAGPLPTIYDDLATACDAAATLWLPTWNGGSGSI